VFKCRCIHRFIHIQHDCLDIVNFMLIYCYIVLHKHLKFTKIKCTIKRYHSYWCHRCKITSYRTLFCQGKVFLNCVLCMYLNICNLKHILGNRVKISLFRIHSCEIHQYFKTTTRAYYMVIIGVSQALPDTLGTFRQQ